ncbi:outer membrane protein assembly factor BamD [Candidatus Desulfovibrio trichonymphae]|uniref:Outer membrane assembly lipoprotein BamD n=1 Tax=Candidatus Desulfovibrio trichonymphae TaxID=1725232 RepID=A0A1J1E1S5_9BACT|nr:outer membrane protein assembly factor BamD [Candidatus Desulfovibrio trichonymphae]BAV91835.1 outer membrane assembly lipoprotein BamD [Candidatus Desulfovibrio trichonymphae]GHU91994.1 outer membrane protein assembly factor BamD [Deltaproteobacteria bacterium]GHU93648.1 outer membrane protein assembly factor BamD [Deltaproteobacteria bacterium]GHU97891.1 outer membrane protein assembly factor BamD [Deltaproteobacteria bacterium]
MYKKFFCCLVVAMSIFTVAGCGIIDMIYLPPAEDTAQEIFEAANDAMSEKNYVRAVELYNKLRDTYPFSPYTLDAELSLADAYFLDEEYELAAESYKDFKSLHPRHQAIPYVLYQTGMSLMKQFRSIDRATTELQEAYDYFNRLCQTYPDAQHVKSADEHMLECRKLMAEHELYIADVFWHMKKYGPAWRRYDFIVNNFTDVPDVANHAKEKSMAAYYHYCEEQGNTVREQRQGSLRKWFNWL